MSFEYWLSSRYPFILCSSQLYLTLSQSDYSPISHHLWSCQDHCEGVQSTLGATSFRDIIVVHETGNEHDRHAMAVYCNEEPGVIGGNSCGSELDGNLLKKSVNFWRLGLGSLPSTTTTLSASIASVCATSHMSRVPKVHFNKRLSIEIRLEYPRWN